MGQGSNWYVYMVECADGSLYAGVTSNVERRLVEHLKRGARAARYTRSHPVVGLAMLWHTQSKGDALSLEWHIHHSSRRVKDELVSHPARANALLNVSHGEPHIATVPINWRRAYWLRAQKAVLGQNRNKA